MDPTHPTGAQSAAAAAGNAATAAPASREQDFLMPIANMVRVMRRVLPAHAKISDDAKEMMQKIVSEFISFVTTEANERCLREQRKTVTGDDLLYALNRLGFDDYIPPVGVYLIRYRDSDREARRHGAGSSAGAHVVGTHEMQIPAAVYGSTPPPELQHRGHYGQSDMYGDAYGAGIGAADGTGGVGLYGAGGGLGDGSGPSWSHWLPPALLPNFDNPDH